MTAADRDSSGMGTRSATRAPPPPAGHTAGSSSSAVDRVGGTTTLTWTNPTMSSRTSSDRKVNSQPDTIGGSGLRSASPKDSNQRHAGAPPLPHPIHSNAHMSSTTNTTTTTTTSERETSSHLYRSNLPPGPLSQYMDLPPGMPARHSTGSTNTTSSSGFTRGSTGSLPVVDATCFGKSLTTPSSSSFHPSDHST